MLQLRLGVELRPVPRPLPRSSPQFTPSPYELLLADIRAGRWRLNPVECRPALPSLQPRDSLLANIRARPNLRPVAQRKLAPRRRKESTARELVMEVITSS